MKSNIVNFPRLLVITVNPWSDKIASGNTISNHLGGWDNSKLSNLFLRSGEIDNTCCENYFRISEKEIVSSLLYKKDLGVNIDFKKEVKIQQVNKTSKISKVKNFLIRIRPTFILLLRELLWKIGFQRRKKLNDFLKQNAPEVIYIGCPNLIYGHRVLWYSHKITKAKIVVFFGDENYSYKSYWPLSLLYQCWLRYWIRKTISISSVNYAATQDLCDYYSKITGKEFKVMYKGISILPPSPKTLSKPLKLVYAGNLLYGRWQTLSLLSKAINEVSKGESVFELSIYTGTPLSKEMFTNLNTNNSTVKGSVSFIEVKKIMKEADIVLHVEAFDKKNIRKTKYSFSTKITDCIESSNCVMGIGPSEIASINFLKNSESAIVANCYGDIVSHLQKISMDDKIITNYRNKMYEFSKEIFDFDKNKSMIFNGFNELHD
jgi:hypothetical protein